MKSILTETYSIHFNSACYTNLNSHIKDIKYSKIFIIVDENTHNHCLPYFLSQLVTVLDIEIIEIEAGETHKTIDTCLGVWNALSELGADRKSLLLNLGGGVITDLGGFIASTFKRGINYINVPTSLLAMVDASIGGKTGVDLGHLKNQIGIINSGEMVLIDTKFLKTLPENQMRSGLAEMLKHGLIYSEQYWNKFNNLSELPLTNIDNLIYESICIKKSIVEQDPSEENLRKTLNFGHTLGHAIESYVLSNPSKNNLLHGEAVAIGMVLACYISSELLSFSKEVNDNIKDILISIYGKVTITETDYMPIIELLKYDKKTEHGIVNFVLLESIGNTKINCVVDDACIIDAFKYYSA